MTRATATCLSVLVLGALLGCGNRTALVVPGDEPGDPEQLTAALPADEDKEPWPQSPDQFQVSLTVLSALEDGPVVCRVTLKNVSQVPLQYGTGMSDHGAYCALEGAGKLRARPLVWCETICGNIGPYQHSLQPGETTSDTFYLHGAFRSLPAGKVTVPFGWCVYRIVRNPTEKVGFDRSLDLLFELKGSQAVDILPATKINLAPVLADLEAEFAQVHKRSEGRPDCLWSSDDPAAGFMKTVTGCRHREFVPLLLRALERLPAERFRQQLVAAVYESYPTPEEGFDVLAGYLESPYPAGAAEVFRHWTREDEDHRASKHRLEALRQPLPPEPDPKKAEVQEFRRKYLQEMEDAWKGSRRHADTRLTEAQFARLLALKNPWVRSLLYSHFAGRCRDDWTTAVYRDLQRAMRPPENFAGLLARLDDDNFSVREKATAELVAGGPALACHLRDLPQDKLPPEAARRVREVLDQAGKPELPLLWRRTIVHLACDPTEHSQKLLDVLRADDSPSLIRRAAQDAHEAANKRRGENSGK